MIEKKNKTKSVNESVRLNKVIADSGIASRRKADELILSGVVKVNGKIVKELGTRVHQWDNITVNGDPIRIQKNLTYILLNKPKDYITTTSDERGRKTVMDIVKKKSRLFPVGRLDRNTTGVLLLTNDGDLAYRLMHPKYCIERVYNVELDRAITNEAIQKISKGVQLDDGKSGKCSIIVNPSNRANLILSISEGKNREIKRIFEKLGYIVKKLDRKIYANLSTQGLKRGDYRHITKKEVDILKKICGFH